MLQEKHLNELGTSCSAFCHTILTLCNATSIGAWSSLKGAERAPYLRAISKKLVEKKEFLAKMETLNCGKPLREALWDLDDVAGTFAFCTHIPSSLTTKDADMAEKLDSKQNKPLKLPDDRFSTVIQYAPTGVVGAIIPWNYVSFPPSSPIYSVAIAHGCLEGRSCPRCGLYYYLKGNVVHTYKFTDTNIRRQISSQ